MKNEKKMNEKGFKASLARFLTHEKVVGFTVPLFCIVLMLIVSSIFLLILGKNPVTAFISFLAGNGMEMKASYGAGAGMLSDFFQFLNVMAPDAAGVPGLHLRVPLRPVQYRYRGPDAALRLRRHDHGRLYEGAFSLDRHDRS